MAVNIPENTEEEPKDPTKEKDMKKEALQGPASVDKQNMSGQEERIQNHKKDVEKTHKMREEEEEKGKDGIVGSTVKKAGSKYMENVAFVVAPGVVGPYKVYKKIRGEDFF